MRSVSRSFILGLSASSKPIVGKRCDGMVRGCRPGSGRLVIDVDSTVCEMEGPKKQGDAGPGAR